MTTVQCTYVLLFFRNVLLIWNWTFLYLFSLNNTNPPPDFKILKFWNHGVKQSHSWWFLQKWMNFFKPIFEFLIPRPSNIVICLFKIVLQKHPTSALYLCWFSKHSRVLNYFTISLDCWSSGYTGNRMLNINSNLLILVQTQ